MMGATDDPALAGAPVQPAAGDPVLAVRDLRVRYDGTRTVHAVNGVSFDVGAGEIFGLVGESGCGKSATLRALIGLLPKTAHVAGEVRFRGADLVAMSERELRATRGAGISMIFQDPMTYLNPVLKISEQINETLRRHTSLDRRQREARAVELLRQVGIASPERRLRQYPHEFSGGMRQRVLIAIALACGSKMLLADEPTTALDVTIQDQILRLLRDLRAQLGMSVVLVSHDLGVIVQTCDRVAVMYGGQLVETARVRELLRAPKHPYTVGLVESLPRPANPSRFLKPIAGAPPSLHEAPRTCVFEPRCPLAEPECRAWETALLDVGPGHAARCRRFAAVEAPVV
jgi:peptide/nickel transport system ATP-binding protein/oligopeptide transport system ATP-binding protein